MLKPIMSWSFLCAVVAVPGALMAQVNDTVIMFNEVMSNPLGTDNGSRSEWVELYNNGDTAVDLSGYTFVANNTPVSTVLPAGSVIESKGFLILAGNKVNFLGEYRKFDPSIVVHLDWPRSTVLHNSNSGHLELIAPGETVAFETVNYQIQTAPWPVGTPNDSISMELNSPTLDNSDGANWTYSPAQLGSPGRPNAPLNTTNITITGGVRNIQYPAPTDTVEVAATVTGSPTTVEVLVDTGSGYVATTLTDNGGGQYNANLGTFPDGTLVKHYIRATDANGYYITQPYFVPEAFFVDDDFPTDDDLVINEIMYNSDGTDNGTNSEWIEVYNRRATPIDMSFFMWGNHTETPNARVCPEGTIIPGNGYLLLGCLRSAIVAQYPTVDPNLVVEAQWVPGGSIFANSNTDQDTPLVHTNALNWNDTRVAFEFVPWRVADPWPTSSDGLSIQLIDPSLDNTVATNWVRTSAVGEETPAAANNVSSVNDWSMY